MDEESERVLKCIHKDQECNTGRNCFYEKECTDPTYSKHCYAIFKTQQNNYNSSKLSIEDMDVVIAGCWSGGEDCHSPQTILNKYQHEVSYKIPYSLLEPSIQEYCFGYAKTPGDISYLAKNNQTLCCCSNSMCNQNIFISNETNPYLIMIKSLNPKSDSSYNPLGNSQTNGISHTQINVLLIASLIFISLIFIVFVAYILFKKKNFFYKKKHDLPAILFSNNSSNAQTGSQILNGQSNRKDDVLNDFKNRVQNEDFKSVTQPLLYVPSDGFFPQNIVAPNIDVLPESLFKQNPVIPKMSQAIDLDNDLTELENFKARFEQQLAMSSKNSNLSEKSDPNMILFPKIIEPADIYLIEKIAHGQFSSVWKGRCKNNKEDEGQEVAEYAIKIFSGMQKSAWSNEKDIYNSLSTTNPYILTHFSSDIHELPKNQQPQHGFPFSTNEYWIITEYHPVGSLCDFLKINYLSWPQMVRLVHSILEGLAYLHSENNDPRKQFAIAHRDLKSKNILVKRDGQTCCIADFGLALKLSSNNKLNSAEIRSKVGTRRYMSPELIEGAIAFSKETFLRIDVYACALVLWEIISRGDFYDEKCDYKLPFEDEVGQNPSLDDMKEIVCDKSFRPQIKENWLKYHKISSIGQTIEECWDIDLDARISSECAASRIRKIYQNSI